jgi:phage shock protein PspC (stress-responsive transcriptional regulator)
MNKVIAINLGGAAYQLEEGGYETLRTYLDTAALRLQGNPDRDEILSDIEAAIAEKFRALLVGQKTVVVTKEVATVLAEMGPIEADLGAASEPAAGASAGTGTGTGASAGAGNAKGPGEPKTEGADPAAGRGPMPRRLYRIHEGAMIAGVCNGIAAYLNIDPTLVRLAFALLTMVWGTGLLVYVVMAIVVPEARSPEEKAAASGIPSTAQEFIRRAKEGYYDAMKGFPDRHARREWKRRFKREMRANADQWRWNWHSYWAQHAAAHPGMGFMLPVLSLLQGAATVVWICALTSLLATGSVLGMALPASVPVWVAALLLFIAYGMVAAPLKLARRSCYWGLGQPTWVWSFGFLLDAVVWLVVVAILLWLAFCYFPELRQAIQGFPDMVHHAADDVRAWWKK